jgi:hypothetical protein
MKLPGAAIVVSAFCLLISCGGDGNGGGKGGSGGSGGAAGASAGGGVTGSAGNTGSTGSAGATGSAGSGGGTGSCQACNACVTANCASQVATCMANSGCNMIYQCAKGCTTSIQTCISNNVAAAQMFASSVYPCISSSCGTECMY